MSMSCELAQAAVETALQGLQDERAACVARLHAVLSMQGCDSEVEGYLKRIDSINAALIRLASDHIVH